MSVLKRYNLKTKYKVTREVAAKEIGEWFETIKFTLSDDVLEELEKKEADPDYETKNDRANAFETLIVELEENVMKGNVLFKEGKIVQLVSPVKSEKGKELFSELSFSDPTEVNVGNVNSVLRNKKNASDTERLLAWASVYTGKPLPLLEKLSSKDSNLLINIISFLVQ